MIDTRLYRLGMVIAAGLLLNGVVGLLNLLHGTPAYAAPPRPPRPLAVYLCDRFGNPIKVYGDHLAITNMP